MLKVSYQLLETELINFTIEDLNVTTTEKDNIVDFRPIISGGYSNNENFIEFTINNKVFVKNEMCSITTVSRYRTETNIVMLDNLKNPEIIDLIARLGYLSNAHLMGMFRIKSYGTKFSEYCIPVREIHEISEMLRSEFNKN